MAEYLIKEFSEAVHNKSGEIKEIYEDKDGYKKEEVSILAGDKNILTSNLTILNTGNHNRTPDVWYNFYEKIKEIKHINKNLNINESEAALNYDTMFNNAYEELKIRPIFTAEENKGKCVDMNDLFLKYLNLKKVNINVDLYKFLGKTSKCS